MERRPLLCLLLPLAAACHNDPGTAQGKPGVFSDTGPVDTAAVDTDTGTADTDTGTADTDTGTAIDDDGDGFTLQDDCDDSDADVHPGAAEICNGIDDDCDGQDESASDLDGDGTADCDDYCPVYASWGAAGDGRQIDPIGSLQAAIDLAAASGCYEVRANGGSYYENLDWGGHPVNVESLSGPEYTIIDAGGQGTVLTFANGEGPDARVYGFTVTNGLGDGGGIYAYYASPTVEGNVITANTAGGSRRVGGGMWLYESDATIIDNEISENDACYLGPEDGCDGGGIDIRGGAPYIAGNRIVDNTAGDGGGIWLAYSDAIIVQNVISGNAADDSATDDGDGQDRDGQGGGINIQVGGPTGPVIASNLIADNIASTIGGGIVVYEDSDAYMEGWIYNNTIVHNLLTETDWGAGIAQFRRTDPVIYNNIIAWNTGTGAWAEDEIDAAFTYNLVYGNDADYGGLLTGIGAGNLSADPRFNRRSGDGDWENDDLHLQSNSPAIDAGDPATSDPDGSDADLGAYGGTYGGW